MTKLLLLGCGSVVSGSLNAQTSGKTWHQANDVELRAILPARAPVGEEHIETEMRTASGIANSRGEVVAGVVMITTGYAANGKYSHYFTTQVPLVLKSLTLQPGNYVLGWQHGQQSLTVRFYEAISEAPRGSVEAGIIDGPVKVESFHLWPPQSRSVIQIGRFGIPYAIGNPE